MPVLINGLVIPDGYRAVAFKRAEEDRWYTTENILQIRYRVPKADYIFNNILNNPSNPLLGSGVYDDDYPTEEGYFWIRERVTTINDITFTSFSLKDRLGFISIKLSNKYVPHSSYSGPRAIAFANEDYILVFILHDASVADFINALSNPYLPPTVWTGHTPTSVTVPVYSMTPGANPSIFTTPLYIPEWRGENISVGEYTFIETRDYYHYHIDFAMYMKALKERMEAVLNIPVRHKSEYLSLEQQYPAFIVYTIDYQDKAELALYRHRGPWATHYWVSARVNFEFHSSDFLIYRGFVIDYNWFYKITNQIPSVVVYGPNSPPGAKGYYASIKWSVNETDWTVQEDIDEVQSSKGYYNYQYDFAAELYYFWIRPKKANVIIQQILTLFTAPAPMDCETIRNVVTQITWIYSGNNIIPDPSQLSSTEHFYLS